MVYGRGVSIYKGGFRAGCSCDRLVRWLRGCLCLGYGGEFSGDGSDEGRLQRLREGGWWC